jgi:ATP-dependent DNA ligase
MIAQSVAASPRQEGLPVSGRAAYLALMLQRTFPAGFIAPCLPTKTDKLPSGDLWLHEIKHDGFRIIARKIGPRVNSQYTYPQSGNRLRRHRCCER